jgi:hypothetical protein
MSFFGVEQGLFAVGGYFLRVLIGVDWGLDTTMGHEASDIMALMPRITF